MEVNQNGAPKIAEVIAIGDELTTGQRLDTNSQWLAEQLVDLGIRASFHSTVEDDFEAKISVFEKAFERADIVIMTGGLGPTADDLTRQVLARVARRPLILDQDSLAHIRGIFEKRNREMPEKNEIQAMFPEGCQIIPNPHGTAPGIDLEIAADSAKDSTPGGCRVFALPGVPAEMKQMWAESVLPALQTMFGESTVIRKHKLNCFGRGESDFEKMLPDLIERDREPRVGITASKATISFRIVATASSEAACLQQIAETESTIRERLGNLVFGSGDDELHDVISNRLAETGQRIAIVDCATQGLMGQMLQSARDSEKSFSAGFAFPEAISAASFFGLDTDFDPRSYGEAEYDHLANAICDRVRTRTNSQIVILTSAPERVRTDSVRWTRFSISMDGKAEHHFEPMIGHPAIKQIRFVKFVLNRLRLNLD